MVLDMTVNPTHKSKVNLERLGWNFFNLGISTHRDIDLWQNLATVTATSNLYNPMI